VNYVKTVLQGVDTDIYYRRASEAGETLLSIENGKMRSVCILYRYARHQNVARAHSDI